MSRSSPHPLEGSALRAKSRWPRVLRPVWERRAASPLVGEAFSVAPADPAAARRVGLVVALLLALPAGLRPDLGLTPIVGFVTLLAALHCRCRRPRVVVPLIVLAVAVHGAVAFLLRTLFSGGSAA